MRDKNVRIIILAYVVFILAISLVGNKFLLDMIVLTCLWAFAAQAWNIAGGYSGQFSLGHCAFFGIGAYTSTILNLNTGLSPWVGMLIGAVLAAIVAAAYSGICNKLKGHFFALATLALGQILYIASVQLTSVTKGSVGINIPFKQGFLNMIFSGRTTYAYIVLTFVLLLTLFTYFMQKSKYGYFLYAIRDNERAAISLGVRSFQLKMASFAVSAFFTAIAGTFYAQYILFIDPDSLLILFLAVQMAIIAIIGGTGSYLGPILGAVILIPLSMLLRAKVNFVSGLDNLIYGLVLMVVVMFLPDGLLPLILKVFKSGAGKKAMKKGQKGELNLDAEV